MFKFTQISRRLSHEHSLSRTFIRLFTLPYKMHEKADNLVNKSSVSLVRRRDEFKESNRGLKISVTKIC